MHTYYVNTEGVAIFRKICKYRELKYNTDNKALQKVHFMKINQKYWGVGQSTSKGFMC